MSAKRGSNNPHGRRGDGKSVQQSNGLTKNQNAHDNAPLKCPLCDHSFTKTRDLVRHQQTLQNLHAGTPQSLACHQGPNPPCCSLHFCHMYSARNHGCRDAEVRKNALANQGPTTITAMIPAVQILTGSVTVTSTKTSPNNTNGALSDASNRFTTFLNNTTDVEYDTNSNSGWIMQPEVLPSQETFRSDDDDEDERPLEDFATFLEARWEKKRLQQEEVEGDLETHPAVPNQHLSHPFQPGFEPNPWNHDTDSQSMHLVGRMQEQIDGMRKLETSRTILINRTHASPGQRFLSVFSQPPQTHHENPADQKALSQVDLPAHIENTKDRLNTQWKSIDSIWASRTAFAFDLPPDLSEGFGIDGTSANKSRYVPFVETKSDHETQPRPTIRSILISNVEKERRTKQGFHPHQDVTVNQACMVHSQNGLIAADRLQSTATQQYGPYTTGNGGMPSSLSLETLHQTTTLREGESLGAAEVSEQTIQAQARNWLYGDN
ncbi:hypothetical protein K431DRAFT_347632 [Polychaeton citri CBS 116435]|uniref:C2H2-type domain-containing protein n=1 Tax=Polychaeton citri CBS 116435 TaxID=1314669 RepID=A0A9P4Q5U7_9PEZI|nr:hypothetical protein K431DRAFT_347632 [Polychaeton citri CBS 116435]